MPNDPQLLDLISRWQEARAKGAPLSPEEVCAEAPERLEELRAYLQDLEPTHTLRDTRTHDYENSPGSIAIPEIPGYEILGILGSGGMGDVLKARYLQLGQDRAVKVIRQEAIINEDHLLRFEREARVLAELDHDNIVTVHEAQLQDGQPYFVMPLIRGGSLLSRLKQYTDDPVKCAELMEQVARAVHYAHEHGIIHRDLKPGNILLNVDGKPLVSDFGIAMLLQRPWEEASTDPNLEESTTEDLFVSRLTMSGVGIGTLPYMAPEQVRGDLSATDRPTDIWALGVILYQLLTGARPFSSTDTRVLIKQIRDVSFIPPHETGKHIDRSLSNIIGKCLQADPRDRYASAEVLANDLRAWRTGARFDLETPKRRALRLAKRWAIPAAAGLTVSLTLLLAVVFKGQEPSPISGKPPEEDPYQKYLEHARQVEAKLKKGESVTLFGPTINKPIYWMRVQTGVRSTPGITELQGEAELHLFSRAASFIEFLPRVPLKHYRVRALLRHDLAIPATKDNRPEVGVGVCYSEYPINTGHVRILPIMAFADSGEQVDSYRDMQGRSALFHVWTNADHPRLVGGQRFQVTTPPAKAPIPPELGVNAPFREITVDVSPTGIKGFWRDEPGAPQRACGDIRNGRLQQILGIIKIQLPRILKIKPKKFAFPTNGGVGIFANDSTVTIGELVIEPIGK